MTLLQIMQREKCETTKSILCRGAQKDFNDDSNLRVAITYHLSSIIPLKGQGSSLCGIVALPIDWFISGYTYARLF